MNETVAVEQIPLWEGMPPASQAADGFVPCLEPYLLPGGRSAGAVVVFPGGGYQRRAPHEGEPVARAFNGIGLHAFVVQYRVSPQRHPAPLMDAARAVRIVRSRAEQWKVDPRRVAVCGFSAGGHLAASVSVHWDPGTAQSDDALDRLSSRPDAAILCYPVVTSGVYAHRGSFANLLGSDAEAWLQEKLSIENQVAANTPPMFLWHTASDGAVRVQNVLLLADALQQKGVPFELHVFPEGRHGLGLAVEAPYVARWFAFCREWLAGLGWIGG